MPEAVQTYSVARLPGADRPLAGLTLLVVEDSRFTCDALRLLCQRSGARLRRADCLTAARRHLGVYRPDVLIVDLGLPDGPGEALIAETCARRDRPKGILAISGDPGSSAAALDAGADRFLPKPIESLSQFQRTILALLPAEEAAAAVPARRAAAPASDIGLQPDPVGLHDDLLHAADLLAAAPDAEERRYLARFLSGLALSAHDSQLADAARSLGATATDPGGALDLLSQLVQARLADADPLGTGRVAG